MSLGGTRLSALFVLGTTAIVVLALIHRPTIPRSAFTAARPLWIFVIFATMTVPVSGITFEGAQNLVAYLLLASTITYAGARRVGHEVTRWLVRIGWLIAGIYATSVLVAGPGSSVIIGRRSFGIAALVYIAASVPLPAPRSPTVKWLPWVLFALVALSLSRMGLVTGALLLVIRFVHRNPRHRPRIRRGVIPGLLGMALLIFAVIQIPALNERFFEGDRARVGGVTFNTEGRSEIWEELLDGIADGPLLGHGPGAASVRLGNEEPHNDYLRVLYDFGWIGFSLFLWSVLALLRAAYTRIRSSTDTRSVVPHVAAMGALLVLVISMFTDNTLIYGWATAPIGVLVGRSLGTKQAEHTSVRLHGASSDSPLQRRPTETRPA